MIFSSSSEEGDSSDCEELEEGEGEGVDSGFTEDSDWETEVSSEVVEVVVPDLKADKHELIRRAASKKVTKRFMSYFLSKQIIHSI